MPDTLTPITREEHFLAKAGGQDVEVPTPITRRETFLQGVIDAIGSGGGGGGGGAASINVTDVPYLAQALQTSVTTAVTAGVTSYPNEPFYYNNSVRNENIVANMETLISFLTDNEGSALYLVSDGVYMPLTYKASTGYVSFKMKGYGTAYAYDLDVEIVNMRDADTHEITGAAFIIYGFVTTNV
jgi:hypothetical protein